jgi:hypothetical protein
VSDKNVYALIAAVSAEIAKTGISKDRNNVTQGYKFRGVDDVYNALAPLISKHGLVIVPRIMSRECVERQTAKGGTLFYTTVEAEFDFISAHDGSKVVARTYGEAMDSGDKSTNKAMSAAYKYVTFQTFCIPTEGDNDADAHTHDVAAAVPKAAPTVPANFATWWADMQAVADNGIQVLQDAWGKSDRALQAYVQANHKSQWESLKAKARAADAKKQPEAVGA